VCKDHAMAPAGWNMAGMASMEGWGKAFVWRIGAKEERRLLDRA
jgi:hypothetical protein